MAPKTMIGRFEHLANRPLAEQARPLLEKIASQVKPIMLKHGYTVGTLAEFFPSNPALLGLNVNGGEKILIRLRPAASPDRFYEWEDLIGTMLHELTHNTHGPHDGKFYKLLSELEEEYYDLRRGGYSGDGFHSDGRRVGGSHGVPEHIGKIKGLEAAELRRQKQALMGRGGKLGGRAVVGRSPREMAAEAAERRMRDDQQCNHSAGAMEAAKQAAEESVGIDAADLDSPQAGPSRSRTRSASPPKVVQPVKKLKPIPVANSTSKAPIRPPTSTRTPPTSISTSTKVFPKPTASEPPPITFDDGSWPCPACTLTNNKAATHCAVCDGPRPRDLSKGWYCDVCGEGPREHGYWMCLGCGSVRRSG